MEEENKNIEVENQVSTNEKVETISKVKNDNLVTNEVENNKQSDETGKKKNNGIYLIIGILLLLVVCVLLFKFVFNKENNNDNNNNSNLNNVTVSDDNVDSYVSVKEVKLRNYFINMDAVIYNCKSEKCTIEDFKNGFMVYDDDSFYFKIISSSEYELLFGSNSNLTQPLILSMNNLEKVEPEKHMVLNYKYDGEVVDDKFFLYNLNNTFFVFTPSFGGEDCYSITPLFNEKEDEFNQVLDNLLVYDSYLIDWKNKKVIYDDNICSYGHIKKWVNFILLMKNLV